MNIMKVYCCMLLLLLACNNKKEVVSEVETPKVKKIDYPVHIDKDCSANRDVDIYDIAEVSYLKLETNTKCLLSRKWGCSGIYITDKDFFISFGANIFRFDLDGHFINTIGNKGGAPFEFANGGIFSVNESSKEVFLLDFSKQRMLVYDYNGKYVRGFRNDTYFDRFWVLNDSLAVCSNNDITIEDRAFTLSLKDGKKKDVLLGKKKIDTGTGTLMVNIGAFSRVCKYQNDIFLCIATTDTVYAYNMIDKKLRPVYIQSPLNKEDDLVKTVPYLQFESSKYASVLINKPPMPDYTYWFNKEDGTLSKVRLKNKELGHAVLGWGTNKKNMIIDILEMPKLKEYEESHTLSGKLQTLVAASKEDDNPIIMIAIIKD